MGHAARLKTEYSFQTESKTILSKEGSITALETHPLLFVEKLRAVLQQLPAAVPSPFTIGSEETP